MTRIKLQTHILLLLFLIISINAIGINKKSENDSIFRIIRVSPAFGIVLPMHNSMTYYVNDFSYGADFNFGIVNYNKVDWREHLNYPEMGIGLFYNTFGNSEIYGQGFSLYPYLQSTIIRSTRFSFRWKVAAGVGYINKPFNLGQNSSNQVLGSQFNVFIGLGTSVSYRFSPNWAVTGNLSFNHLSNGAYQKPNNGINTVTGGIGLGYYFNQAYEPEIRKVKPPRSNARDLSFALGFGQSQSTYFNPKMYPSISLSVDHLWWTSAKTAWGVGADWFYYGAAPYRHGAFYQVNSEVVDKYSKIEKTYGCIFGSFNRAINKTRLYLQLGVYVLYTIKPVQAIYPKLGISHFITDKIYVKFGLKASFFEAEFLEFGIGYRINYAKNKL